MTLLIHNKNLYNQYLVCPLQTIYFNFRTRISLSIEAHINHGRKGVKAMKKFLKILLGVMLLIGVILIIDKLSKPNIKSLEKSQDVDKLIQALYHKRISVRNDAEDALIRIGSPAVESLLLNLNEKDADIGRIAKILGDINDERAIEPLTLLLNDNDEYKARAAANALANFGEAGVIPLIEAAKKHPENDYFYVALVRAGKPAVAPICNLLKHENEAVKEKAIWVLEEIHDPSSEEALIEALEDETLVFKASNLIVSFHNEDATVLLPYLKKKSTVGVYKTIILYGDPVTIKPLTQALESYGDEHMAEYYFNCGNAELESSAQAWAKENGYTVFSYSTSIKKGGKWGSK